MQCGVHKKINAANENKLNKLIITLKNISSAVFNYYLFQYLIVKALHNYSSVIWVHGIHFTYIFIHFLTLKNDFVSCRRI